MSQIIKAISLGLITIVFTITTDLTIAPAQAKDIQYISDAVPVEMRSGPSNGYRIKAWPKPGTMLEIKETSTDGDWIKVITMKGTDGWVRKQHLSNRRSSKELLDIAKNNILNLESEKIKQDTTITQLQDELSQINNSHSALANTNSSLNSEYDSLRKISKNAVQADRSNRDLRKKNELFKIKVEELVADNERLKHDRNVEGITTGMLAVALGGIMAFSFMQLGRRKRQSSGWD